MDKEYTLITARTVYRVKARSKEQVEQAAREVGLVVQGIAEDRPPRRTAVGDALVEAQA